MIVQDFAHREQIRSTRLDRNKILWCIIESMESEVSVKGAVFLDDFVHIDA